MDHTEVKLLKLLLHSECHPIGLFLFEEPLETGVVSPLVKLHAPDVDLNHFNAYTTANASRFVLE